MRLVSKDRHVFDNPVRQQYELYRNGSVIGTAKYRIHDGTMIFILCEACKTCSAADREAFYLTALRDARARRLAVTVTSRSMQEVLGHAAAPV